MKTTAVDFTAIDQKKIALEEVLITSGKVGAHEKLFVGSGPGNPLDIILSCDG